MRKTSIILLTLALAQLIIVSCSQSDPITFDSNYLNRQITLSSVQNRALTTKDPIFLLLLSSSDDEIDFPSNFNLQIFIKQDNKWVEINEWPVQRSQEDVIMSPASNLQIISFLPQLENENQRYYMRVYVFGEMKTDNGNKKVAAYVDIILTP